MVMVVPIPQHPSLLNDSSLILSLLRFTLSIINNGGLKFPFFILSSKKFLISSIAMELATSPALCPPIPSATAYRQ
jgi:hypothetical protein